ncbi:MAG: pyridoxal-phosphate dependent enzyme, partial [Kiloniellaceae bacterium]|nr:pyridoxal-phosphate dependent enzyme [Kiloniellaceae bacterium]
QVREVSEHFLAQFRELVDELATLGDPDAVEAQLETVTTEADEQVAAASARATRAEQAQRRAEVERGQAEAAAEEALTAEQDRAARVAELDEQLVEAGAAGVGLVAVPVGVGALAQAAVAHYRGTHAKTAPALLAVEPAVAACVLASLARGRLTSVPTGATVMAGLNCGTPSGVAWPYL